MKKIFSAFLLMTMMVASVGSFVSCSDIEDAIAKVENTANDNAAQIKDLEGKVAALQTALATAQADAAAAKAAADKAAQAAATAKAEAIEAALAEIAKVQGDVDGIICKLPKTVTLPYSDAQAVPICLYYNLFGLPFGNPNGSFF